MILSRNVVKTLLIATLLASWQAPPQANAQSVAQKAAKTTRDFAEHVVRELASQGIETSLKSAIGYFNQNNHETNNSTAELARRLKACKSGSQDPICELLRPPQ
jgi:hypothetical protein